jgi:FG-GAP-like repeat/Tetratricopeptide repeat
MRRFWILFCLCLVAAETRVSVEERLWQHRNLGKAYYENPITQVQAVGEFQKALLLEPNSVRERLNYGLALLKAGRTKEGVAELEKVQKQDGSLPHTWFSLGIVFRKDGEFERAIAQFEKMVELAPGEPVSHYNLGVLYKQVGKLEGAAKQLETAEKLDAAMEAPHFQLYNIYRQAGRREDSARELGIFQTLKKEHEGAAIPQDPEWCAYAEIYDPIDIKDAHRPAAVSRLLLPPSSEGQLPIDVDGDGKAELLVWNKDGLTLLRGRESMKNTGLEDLQGVVSAAAGDFDNDGLADLCILTENGPLLYRNVKGKFEKVDANLPAGRFEKAVWLDYDHDYDLDLLLLGEKSLLLRNQGTAGFVDHTSDFPFVAGHALDAVSYRWMADSKAFDLVVSYADHAGVLYSDKLSGKYEAMPLPELPAGAKWLEAADVNDDGWLDIVSSAGTLLNQQGKFEHAATPIGDGSVEDAGTARASKWIRVTLNGVKNLKLGYDAEVEIKAGASYQKKVYRGVPLLFDLGGRLGADTVRITWPNGLIQNDTKQLANHSYTYKEEQRLSGSCPMIWTFDGKQFRFISDVLGVAPLGASSGDGKYFPVDHDEYIQIPGDALKAVDDKYEVRVTEELSEVSYLDQIELLAVDHPEGVEIFTNEKWKGPPYPEFRLFGVNQRIYPRKAGDGEGRDVLQALLARDRKYVDTFRRDRNGKAELHELTLDFGKQAAPDNRAVLVLNGWVDWADGSTFLGAAQESKEGLIPPYLQVKDAAGNWKTVIQDMGMPDGKPKTIAVDLSGKFLSESRQIRIVTNLCVYWDEVFLGNDVDSPQAVTSRAPASSGELRFRGFSTVKIDSDRKQPEEFTYANARAASAWNPTPGLYTRYGDVKEILESVDDRFAILGSGDEVRLQFRADALAGLKPGWKREFILKVDGWAKDRDANTAYSQSVEPLPFHAMSAYPYRLDEHFPQDPVHERYRREYNTRPALRLIRPLVD